MKKQISRALLMLSVLGLIFALTTPQAFAQSPYELKAQVNTNDITTDETVTLTLTLTTPDGNAPRLNMPALDGWNILGSQTASQYSIVNGKATASMAYAYELQPTRTGDLEIPTLRLEMNGQPVTTDPITVHVTQGNGTPRQPSTRGTSPFGSSPFGSSLFGSILGNDPFNDPFFSDPFGNDLLSGRANLQLNAAADKTSVYVGEPVEYTVRMESDAMLLGEPEYKAPKFTGFWAHQPPVTRQGPGVTEITTLLFPTKGGELTIDPATISSAGGFFSDAIEKQTEPVTIEVKPLPDGAPGEFSGAVGQFEITATPDKTETRVGEPIVMRVEIRGAGNLDTLPDPQWVNDPNWRAFDAKAETNSQAQNGNLAGTRTYERTLIPTKEGTLTVPVTRYAYFDPADEQYHVIETEPVTIRVAPGDPSVAQNVIDPSSGASNPTADSAAGSSVTPLKPAGAELTTAAKPLVEQPLFLALFLVPLGIIALDIGLGLRKRYLDSNMGELRAGRALKNARRSLRRAAQSKNVSLAVSNTVLHYLEDKTNRSLLGVSHSAIAQLLAQQGVSDGMIHNVMLLLLAGETSEFGSPAQAAPAKLIADAELVLKELEGEWQA